MTVAAMPWARHQSGHTLFFDDQVAWLATQTSKTAITLLMRIAWRSVGVIITRVWADTEKQYDQFADLTRIGIDEIPHKHGHKYLTCVVDHDSGRHVWAAPGQNKAALDAQLAIFTSIPAHAGRSVAADNGSEINNPPCKIHGWATPQEVLQELTTIQTTQCCTSNYNTGLSSSAW